MRERFRGTWVALVTPMNGGRLDEEALRRLVTHCLEGGVDGLVPVGCTGEARPRPREGAQPDHPRFADSVL